MSRSRCLPVAPSVEQREVVIVRYCTGEGTEREPAHEHVAFYATTGELLGNVCTHWPHHDPQSIRSER